MRIRHLLLLIIIVLATACQSTPRDSSAEGGGVDESAAPAAEELADRIAELEEENRELRRSLESSEQVLEGLDGSLQAAVAPDEAGFTRQELLARARALRQENFALRRVIDELLYLDTLAGVDYAAPPQPEPIPAPPVDSQPPSRTGRTAPPAPQPTTRPTAEARDEIPPAITTPPTTPTIPPPAAAITTAEPRRTAPRVTPSAAIPTNRRSDGFLETEVLAVPPKSPPYRAAAPLGGVMALGLVDGGEVVYVDRRSNFLSESPVFLGLQPVGSEFDLTFWAVVTYPEESPPLLLRSVIIQTPRRRHLFSVNEGQLRRYVNRGERVEVFSQPFGPDHTSLVDDITATSPGESITVTFVGGRESTARLISQPDRDAMINLVYGYRAAGGRLP